MAKGSYRFNILKKVSGCALPGKTTFIMGSSGAGKTTLLNVLSDRIRKSGPGINFSGSVKINDSDEVNQNTFGSIAGYVM